MGNIIGNLIEIPDPKILGLDRYLFENLVNSRDAGQTPLTYLGR